jgi:hypothetical protein
MRFLALRLSKFVIQGRTLAYELQKAKGTSELMFLVPLFEFEVAERIPDNRCRDLKSAALE